MSQHAVVHFEIGGPDGKALQDFYGKLFGWTINADNPMDYPVVFKMDGGIGGGLPKSQDGSSFVMFYVTCGDDVAGMLKKAEGLGAKVALDTVAIEGGPTIASFTDPDGNMIGLVNGEADQAADMTGEGAPVSWFEIMGDDPKKIQDWYRKLFDWEINADNPMGYGETPHVGNGIGGGIFGMPGVGAATRIYAEVDDLESTLAKAGELGGKTTMEPDQVPGGPKIAMFSDPAGNTIGLMLAGSGQQR